MSIEGEKQLAAEAAAELVESGMTLGLGTGSTVAYLLPALARRKLSLRCVASSVRTEVEGSSGMSATRIRASRIASVPRPGPAGRVSPAG